MFDIVAYKERESMDPVTGAEGILRTEWRIIPLTTWEKTHDPYAVFGPNWTTYKPRAKFVMEQRYIRRGVDEGWKPFDLYDSREDALSSIDSDAKSASSSFTKVEEARIAAARTAKIHEAQKREADAAASVKRAKQQRSQDAFGRLSEGKGKALTDAYNAFVTAHMNDAAVRGQILADRSLYDAIMDAETVPAKAKAIRAFLKRYASAGGKRRRSKARRRAGAVRIPSRLSALVNDINRLVR